MAEHDDLSGALRKARLAEAAHLEALLAVKDSKSLRLQVLKDDISPAIAATADAAKYFDLIVAPGEQPRLWIDMISSVVMEPDFRTYRLLQDNQGGREVLLETSDRAEMVNYLKTYLAHRMIARERNIARALPLAQSVRGFSMGALLYAWLTGFMLGVLVLLVAAILSEKLHF